MLKIDSYEELLNIMIEDAVEEGTVSFITNTDGIHEMLDVISETIIKPDLIDFNSSSDNYYYICLDFDEDDETLTYSIIEAYEYGHFFGLQGIVYSDYCVPEEYYIDVKNNKYIKESPIRITFDSECDCDGDCENCCCIDNVKEEMRIDSDENTGKILGFNKSWDESEEGIRRSYSFSFHSSDEKSVKEMMKRFGIE